MPATLTTLTIMASDADLKKLFKLADREKLQIFIRDDRVSPERMLELAAAIWTAPATQGLVEVARSHLDRTAIQNDIDSLESEDTEGEKRGKKDKTH